MDRAVLVGLPGNPVAALVTFLWFARPIVERRMGLNPSPPRPVPARAAFEETRRPGRDEFIPVRILDSCDGQLQVEKLGRAGSSRLSPLLGADGFARIPAGWSEVLRGDVLPLYLFDGAFPI
jgi:molybdopterin molybdotransferase